MAGQPVMTVEEWFEGMRHGAPPTSDDVSVSWDDRRLDSRQGVVEWIAEVDARRAEENAARRDAGPDGPPHDLARLIEVLNRHGVEYLIVGGAESGAF